MARARHLPQAWQARVALLVLFGACTSLFLACGPDTPREPVRRAAAGYDTDGRWLGAPLPPGRRPNLVVVVLDTLRADALSPEAPERGVMPRLAAWAREGVAVRHAVAPAPWTQPSVVSLLTGLLPGEHRQGHAKFPPPDPAALVSFAEILGRTFGYETRALVGLPAGETPANVFLGFEHIEPDTHLAGVPERLEAWARARTRERPFFLMLHSFEVHDPYGAANHPYPVPRGWNREAIDVAALGPDPDPLMLTKRLLTERDFRHAMRAPAVSARMMPLVVGAMFDGLRRDPDPLLGPSLHQAYRAGAAWVDGLLDGVLGRLGAWGLLDDTLVVVTADHGEAFGEHGSLQHMRWLYDELLRIPLALRGPPPFDRPRTVEGQVALHDVLPTFFDWAGLPMPADLEGRSFLPLLTTDGAGRPVVSEEVRTPANTGGRSHAILASARTRAWKFIVTHELLSGAVTEELYDLAADPGERTNLLPDATRRLPRAMVDAIEAARARVHDPALRLVPGTPPPAPPRPAPFAVEGP
jgi:arylsulfatase A-like enzyme